MLIRSEILDKAKADAEAAVQAARESAEAEAAKILERAKRDAADYGVRVDSSMDMQRKQAILAAKQEVIGRVLVAAYETIMNLDAAKYFEMLEQLLEKHALPEAGAICFSAKDLGRMPAGFPDKIKNIAASKGGSLTVSEKPEKMDGGFLLVYGGIEENCTLSAVFASRREQMSDQENRLLFG